jgi:hypothetical protein
MKKRKNFDGKQQTLHVKAGQKIEFPVAKKHRHARFQTLTPVRSASDVHEFLSLRARDAASRERPAPNSRVVVSSLREAKLRVLRLVTRELRIDKGAVLTLNNPLNQLDFDNVTIKGDLVVRGDLILNCNTLTIE